MNRDIIQPLPAGLMNSEIEFFTHGTEVYQLSNGKVTVFSEIDNTTKEIIRQDLEKRPQAVSALLDLQIQDTEAQLKQYTRCMCGGFQGHPDIVDGKLIHTEYWDCGIRGNCKYEGKLCASITINNTRITEREIELGKLICTGLPDKIIAGMMNISENTINPMKRNICEKINGTTKLDIMNFFIKHNFYDPAKTSSI